MYSLCDLIMTGFTLFIIGLSVGAILIASAEDCSEDATEIIYNAGYEKGYRDGKKEGATDDGTTGATSSQI